MIYTDHHAALMPLHNNVPGVIIEDPKDQILFLLGGHAHFYLFNKKTGNRFEYKAYKPKNKNYIGIVKEEFREHNYNRNSFSNPSWTERTYYGTIAGLRFKPNPEVRDQAQKVLTWYLDLLFNNKPIPPFVHLLHLGQCGKCGRELTDPESIKRGIGPVCASRK